MKEIIERFTKWVDDHGGSIPVAIAIGKSPQTFYNYANRGSKPNMEIFALLANKFPDFDPGYILTGMGKSDKENAEIERLRYELSVKDATITKLVMPGKSEGAINSPERAKEIRKETAKESIKNTRRKNGNLYLPGRAQGVSFGSRS